MSTTETKELTKAEEQVMQAILKIGKGFANEIVAAVDIDHIISEQIKSKYDYRIYFKAK